MQIFAENARSSEEKGIKLSEDDICSNIQQSFGKIKHLMMNTML